MKNARSTGSGKTSVLIEPCRKKFRSSCDQLDTCSMSILAGVDVVSAECNVVATHASEPRQSARKFLIIAAAIIEKRRANCKAAVDRPRRIVAVLVPSTESCK